MLSIQPQETHQPYYLPLRRIVSPPSHIYFQCCNMGGGQHPDQPAQSHNTQFSEDATVAQALEIARESPDGAQDPTVSSILESALARSWSKVQAHPDSYIMTRDEFAVFNFFQHRFAGNKTAIAARKRYWDNSRA